MIRTYQPVRQRSGGSEHGAGPSGGADAALDRAVHEAAPTGCEVGSGEQDLVLWLLRGAQVLRELPRPQHGPRSLGEAVGRPLVSGAGLKLVVGYPNPERLLHSVVV